MTVESQYQTLEETALSLNLTTKTVEQWVDVGALLGKKEATGLEILKSSILSIIEERQNFVMISPVASDVLKIAIVEDDLDLTKLLEMTIHNFDYKTQIYSCTNGLSGLALHCEYRPDVLIVDLNMPIMDGFRMINALENSELAPKKIIVTTALSAEDIKARGGLPKRAIVISKPFSLSELEGHLQPNH